MSDSIAATNYLKAPASHAERGLASFLAAACIYTTFFAPYLGSSFYGYGFGALLILLRLHKIRLTLLQVVALGLLETYAAFVLLGSESPTIVLMNLRHWFGGVFFCVFFLVCKDMRLVTPRFFYLVCATVIVEAIAINTVINASSLPNYPYEFEGGGASSFGFYERPLSFTGSPTMSSGALVVLYYLHEKSSLRSTSILDLALLVTCVTLFASGTGFVLFLLLLLLKAVESRLLSLNWLVFGVVLAGFYLLLTNVEYETFRYASLEYYRIILDLKIDLLSAFFSESASTDVILFGTQVNDRIPITSGDFGWYHLLSACGVLGTLVFFFLVFSFLGSGVNRLPPLLILFAGTVHYPVAMSQAGQLLFGFILVSSARCFRPRISA